MLSVNSIPTNLTTGVMAFKGKPSAKELKKFEKNYEKQKMSALLKSTYVSEEQKRNLVKLYNRDKMINIVEKLFKWLK